MAKGFKITYKGDLKDLERCAADASQIMEAALLEGANVAADALRSQLNSLKTSDEIAPQGGKRYVNKTEKQALSKNMGYSPQGERGSKIDRKAGFKGYTAKGFPVPKLANFINKGAGYQMRQPFLDVATTNAKREASSKIEKKINEEITKRLKT